MSISWSNEETFKFIDLYRSEPAIWDPNNALHKERNKVNDAWNRIADSLQIPVSELKKKKETLMSAFRMHLKKKLDSIRSGTGEEEIYKPIWVFYDAMEAFLIGKYTCKSIVSTDEQWYTVTEQASQSQQRKVVPRKRKKTTPTEDIVTATTSDFYAQESTQDTESDVILKYWATKLNKLAPDQRRYAEKIINDVLFEGEMGALTRNGVRFLPVDSPSCELSPSPDPLLSHTLSTPSHSRVTTLEITSRSPSPNDC